MVLVASGYTNKEIAKELDTADETVKSHLKIIFLKLGVHNRVEAVNVFIEDEA